MGGNIQTTYGQTMAVAVPGMRKDDILVTSRIAEGAITFGYGVKRGTAKDTQVIAGGGTGFLGIALHTLVPEAAYSDATINVGDTETLEVLRDGMVWCVPANDVVAGDNLVVVTATGQLKGGAGASGETLVTNAYWETSASAGGYALLYLAGACVGSLKA